MQSFESGPRMTKTDDETAEPAEPAPPSLSVVIPFYRDEVYLEDAVVSAAAQPIADLEVIVVNDNPGPDSEAFLAAIAARHPIRIVTHETNRGLAAARNTGIEAATRNFVTFIDADDTFISGALAANLDFAAACGSDITHAPTLSMYVGRLHPGSLRRDHLLFGKRIVNARLRDAPQAQYIVSSWASIYRRDFLMEKAIRFDEAQTRFEDRLFVLDAIFAAGTISFSDVAARIWRRRLGSITTAEREIADIAMQTDLLVKCVASAKRYAGVEGDNSLFLQRELHHSICRVIWDVRVLDHDPADSPALDDVRRRLTEAFRGLRLRRRVFADRPTMVISHLGKESGRYAAVTRPMLLEAYAMVREGKWAELYAWRLAQRKPDGVRAVRADQRLDKELILHIGMHKTGSTFLQRMLERDRARLAENGILFPETGFLGRVMDNRRGAATPGHVGFPGALKHDREPIFKRLREECAASGCERVLISAENLSFPFDTVFDRSRFLVRAEEFFSFLPRRRIIAFWRRPDEYIDRYYREHVFLATGWARRTAEQFAAELGPQMTDLRFLTGDWEAFAGGALDLIGYEAARTRGLHVAFYEKLGLAPPDDISAADATYPSPSAEQVHAGRIIAMTKHEKADKATALGEFLARTAHLPRDRAFELMGAETRLRLIDGFAARSLGYLRDRGGDAPVDEWRASAMAGPPAHAAAIDPGYVDAAIAAIANIPPEPFEREAARAHLKLYRFGKAAVSRFR